MGGLDPGDNGCGRMEGLETHHWVGGPLDETVVLLEEVVEAFDLPDRDHLPVSGELQDDIHRLQAR